MACTAALLVSLGLAAELLPIRCSQAAWQATWRRTAPVRQAAGALIVWGLVSCTFQDDFALGNLAFWGMCSLNYLVAFRSVPRLVSGLNAEQRTLFLSAVLAVAVVLSCLFGTSGQSGRFTGIFRTPNIAGAFAAAAVIHCTAALLFSNRRRNAHLLLLGMAAFMLLATRTRAAIGAAMLGTAVCLVYAYVKGRSRVPGRAAFVLGTVSCLLVGSASCFLLTAHTESFEYAAEYLRVSGGAKAVYERRSLFWERGASEFFESGLVGRGFLSKFGNTTGTRNIAGIEFPRYDWTTTEDPHNSLFLINQQIGLPGAVFFLLLLWSLWRCGSRADPQLRPYFVSFFVAGLVHGFIAENWLDSFAASFDRYSYVALAALVYSVPGPARWCKRRTSGSSASRSVSPRLREEVMNH